MEIPVVRLSSVEIPLDGLQGGGRREVQLAGRPADQREVPPAGRRPAWLRCRQRPDPPRAPDPPAAGPPPRPRRPAPPPRCAGRTGEVHPGPPSLLPGGPVSAVPAIPRRPPVADTDGRRSIACQLLQSATWHTCSSCDGVSRCSPRAVTAARPKARNRTMSSIPNATYTVPSQRWAASCVYRSCLAASSGKLLPETQPEDATSSLGGPRSAAAQRDQRAGAFAQGRGEPQLAAFVGDGDARLPQVGGGELLLQLRQERRAILGHLIGIGIRLQEIPRRRELVRRASAARPLERSRGECVRADFREAFLEAAWDDFWGWVGCRFLGGLLFGISYRSSAAWAD